MGAGLAYRHAFFARERARRPFLLLVDSGNVAENAPKLPAVLKIMGIDRYDAVGLGSLDLRHAAAYAPEASRHGIPLVRAIPRDDALDALAPELRVKRLRGHDIGVSSLPPPPAGMQRDAYLGVAARALAEMRGRCEFLILLSQLGLEGDKELARRCGSAGPHAIIGNLEANVLTEPLQVEGSVLLPTGSGGTHAGIAEVAFPILGQPKVERVSVVPAKVDGTGGTSEPAITEIINNFYIRAQKLFVEGIDRRLLAADMANGAGDEKRCRKCHEQEHGTWKETRHSKAVDTLIGHKRLVPECIVCHSSRYAATGIFDRAARAGDVDCTACHPLAGKGEPAACPEKATRTRGAGMCRVCHTKVNSPDFDYARYYARVNHSWEPGALAPDVAPAHADP